LKWGTGLLCPRTGGQTDVEAGTGATLLSSKNYSRSLVAPQTSPGAARRHLEQRRRLLCLHAQPGPENLTGRVLQYAPLAAHRGLQRSQFHPAL